MPETIKTPKGEEWGSCLCMTCLNSTTLTFAIVKDGLLETTNKSDRSFDYLEWSKEKGENVKAETYYSKKCYL